MIKVSGDILRSRKVQTIISSEDDSHTKMSIFAFNKARRTQIANAQLVFEMDGLSDLTDSSVKITDFLPTIARQVYEASNETSVSFDVGEDSERLNVRGKYRKQAFTLHICLEVSVLSLYLQYLTDIIDL
jgi:hypothetical protein